MRSLAPHTSLFWASNVIHYCHCFCVPSLLLNATALAIRCPCVKIFAMVSLPSNRRSLNLNPISFAEAKYRCNFFLDIFDLTWPADIDCDTLPDSPDPDICVGNQQTQELNQLANRRSTVTTFTLHLLIFFLLYIACKENGFRCDVTRCIPPNWKCDGYIGKMCGIVCLWPIDNQWRLRAHYGVCENKILKSSQKCYSS